MNVFSPGVMVEDEDEGDDDPRDPVTPVFPTQIPLEEEDARSRREDPDDRASQASTNIGKGRTSHKSILHRKNVITKVLIIFFILIIISMYAKRLRV
jgi:hypothetical protein